MQNIFNIKAFSPPLTFAAVCRDGSFGFGTTQGFNVAKIANADHDYESFSNMVPWEATPDMA